MKPRVLLRPSIGIQVATYVGLAAIVLGMGARELWAQAGVAGFHTLSPCRIVDTRASGSVPIGGASPLRGGETTTADVRGACGLPGNAIAISFNATVTQPTAEGNVRIFPGGIATPGTSVMNYVAGQTRANNGIVPLSADGRLSVFLGQAAGTTAHFILDVNGYFVTTNQVATAAGLAVVVRPAPEVEITFDNVTTAGTTTARVLDFVDNRTVVGPQNLKAFFPPGSPEEALVPSAIVPGYLVPLPKGGPGGTPTFVLSLIDSTATFARTAEFHGHEDFRLGWDPPCRNPADRTQEPRTFYAREGTEPPLAEESGFGGPAFVDISSGCGSNKGSGWNFSAYLTARDTRSPRDIAHFMLTQMQAALTQLSTFITSGVATQIGNEVTAAIGTLDTTPTSSLANVDNVVTIVDANPGAFTNTTRNVSGEFVGRALSARYMLRKVIGFDVYTEPEAFQGALQGLTPTTITFDNLGLDQTLPNGTALSGATFNFSASGFPGVATNDWLSVSRPQTLGINRGPCVSGNPDCWFFFPGDSVTLTFSQPVRAIGAFFSSNAGAATLQEFITISTPVGTAKNRNALPAGLYGFPPFTLRFVGLVSEVPFSTATFSAAQFGMAIDDITYATVAP